jgi:tetratricopeptide (TPR) repeat protein
VRLQATQGERSPDNDYGNWDKKKPVSQILLSIVRRIGRFNQCWVSHLERKMKKRTDFEIELERIEKNIAELTADARTGPIDAEKITRIVYGLYRRASLTGSFADFEVTETAINSAIRQVGPWPDLCLLKANLDFKFHRLAKVKQDLELAPSLASSPSGRVLRADLDLQEGRYDEARTGYEKAIEEDRSWDNLARLAYFQGKLGDEAAAEQFYLEAEEEITAKEMRSYAWVELQRGLLDLAHGRHEDTWAHYHCAKEAYSGYWLVDEHIAELLGAEGRLDEAVSLYETVVTRVPKPELKQAIGEIYSLMGKSNEAEPWYEEALVGYLQSAERGQVHYYHHLADYYSHVREEAGEAVGWARKDLELRPNFATEAALAWALCRNGQIADALDLIDRALSSGVKDAQIFYKAGMIYLASGRGREGEKYLEQADQINSHHRNFHVHH